MTKQLFERVADDLQDSGAVTRRFFVGKAARWGAGLFAGLAALVAASPAYAACRTVGCCVLAYCNDCQNPTSCVNCQSGRYEWGCVDQYHHLWTCIECWAGSCAGCSLAIYGTAPAP
jgi:hypothetical protein